MENQGRSVRQRTDNDFLDAAADTNPAAPAAASDVMQTKPIEEISQDTTPDQIINIFRRILPASETNMTLLRDAVKINNTLEAGQEDRTLEEKIKEMKQILIDGGHVTELKGGRRRSSSARKSSSRRGRRSAKKRGTQRKQKRRQRRASRRAY